MESQADVEILVDRLTKGFAALTSEYILLREEHNQLEKKLSWAKQQHLDLLQHFDSETAPEETNKFLDELQVVGQIEKPQFSHWLDPLFCGEDEKQKDNAMLIQDAEAAQERLRNFVKEDGQVKIWKGPSADRNGQPASLSGGDKFQNLERDFTTPGTPSRLGCPFNQKIDLMEPSSDQQSLKTPRSTNSRAGTTARRSKRASFVDPIKAEVGCAHDTESQAGSIEGPVCPIRFIDQHSPEEVAQYFENHKHELPRSHEICVKRFQSNAESIRKLDAKYGNLVSMIQGLGVKHKAWLPDQPEDEEVLETSKNSDKIQKWATAVSSSVGAEVLETPEKAEEEGFEVREPHFDRPLKEIRVGESPSRPWGITIPAKYTAASTESPIQSPTAAKPLLIPNGHPNITSTGAKQCPFSRLNGDVTGGHAQKDAPVEEAPEVQAEENNVDAENYAAPTELPKNGPQLVFNGPVFFGYPPEQIAILLQSSNLNSGKP